MMKRLHLPYILCPTDFSGMATASLSVAGAVARARTAELRTMHVVPTAGVATPEHLGSLEHETIMGRLRRALSEAAPGYERIGAAVRQGDPATQILRLARALPADLIVMAAPGADRPERPMGSVASIVVARSQCSVLAVPARSLHGGRNETGVFSRIVCAVDLAPSSAGVIRQALSLAWETQGSLSFVCVASPETPATAAAVRDRLLAAIPAEARGWCESDVIVTAGTAGTEIVSIADDLNADVVVVGAPRRFTSTAHAILNRSLCPVLVAHDTRPLPWPVERKQSGRTLASAV